VSTWPATKARKVFRALQSIGWEIKNEVPGSHLKLSRDGYPDYTWGFHDSEEIGPVMLGRIAKKTGLKPEDL
jgi:predicted RNA binding protein YcfA (HicA-like mRNA interferase family)